MFYYLLYDAFVVFGGIGYGIIGNTIRYYKTKDRIWESIIEIQKATYTELLTTGKQIQQSLPIFIPVGTMIVPVFHNVSKTEEVRLSTLHYKTQNQRYPETESHNELENEMKEYIQYIRTNNASNTDGLTTEKDFETFRKEFKLQNQVKNQVQKEYKGYLKYIGTDTFSKKEFLNTEKDFENICKKLNIQNTDFPMKLPISMTTVELPIAYHNQKYISNYKDLVFKETILEKRLPLTFTIIGCSILLLGLSHYRYNSTYHSFQNSTLSPIFSPRRYRQIYNQNFYTT